MRPSWRTATSGRAGPTRRRGSASASGRATSSRSSGGRPSGTGGGGRGAWDDHLQAERDEVAAEEAAKWERRRLQALEEGWQLCRSLRARLEQMLAIPPETPAVAPPEPAGETPEAIPDAVATPEEAGATAGRGPSRWNDLAVVRLSKLVVELEWALLNEALPPPGMIDPLTATPEELEAYLARHPRLGRPPPR